MSSTHTLIECRLCGKSFRRLARHVRAAHGYTKGEYEKLFPGSVFVTDESSAKSSRSMRGKRVVKRTSFYATTTTEPEPETAPAPEPAPTPEPEDLPPHVPTTDRDWVDVGGPISRLLKWTEDNGENIMIVGPTGCGKSAAVIQEAANRRLPLRRLNLNGEIRVADFVGEKTVEVDPQSNQAVVVWRDGILPQAMRAGHWLLLDEVDAAPPHVLFVLQAVLEAGHTLTLADNEGEVVTAAPGFRIIATANTIGKGDDTGLYTGTNVLNEAFLDRFAVVVTASYPGTEKETKILSKKAGVDAKTARSMVVIANRCRRAMDDGTLFTTMSTRRLIAWARLSKEMGVADAMTFTVLNKAGEDRGAILEIAKRIFN